MSDPMTTERAAFEAWLSKAKAEEGPWPSTRECAWSAWQAARRAQPAREPLTPVRQAALDLYLPPFRHLHGYVRDANDQVVSDEGRDVALGTIAARIRGWGRIQYMDKPELRAAALQDEVGEIVADALNRYWAAHGITTKDAG